MGMSESLTHKLGPLPVWAWGGVGVAAALVLGGMGRKGSGAAPASSDDSQFYPQAGQGAVGVNPYGSTQINELVSDQQQTQDLMQAAFNNVQKQLANTQYQQWWNTQLFGGAAPDWKPPFPELWPSTVSDPYTQPGSNQSDRYDMTERDDWWRFYGAGDPNATYLPRAVTNIYNPPAIINPPSNPPINIPNIWDSPRFPIIWAPPNAENPTEYSPPNIWDRPRFPIGSPSPANSQPFVPNLGWANAMPWHSQEVRN